jgi:hypothetical protein
MHRKLYPLPVQELIENPRFKRLPVAGRGMLITLILYFWETECHPLPTSPHDIFCIVRAFRPTWKHYHEEIMLIFEEVRPSLETYFKVRQAGLTSLRQMGKLGGAKVRARALARKAAARTDDLRAPVKDAERAAATAARPLSPDQRGAREKFVPTRGR